jgi:glycosyltransferase involved in cell wall biosynthesis
MPYLRVLKYSSEITRRLIVRWMNLEPGPSFEDRGRTYPAGKGRTRVLMLVSNSVDHDTRVKKFSAALRDAGYSVGLLGITKPKAIHTFEDPGLTRAMFRNVSHGLYFRKESRQLRRLSIETLALKRELKVVAASGREHAQLLADHDALIRSISTRSSLTFKLGGLIRQLRSIREYSKALERSKSDRARITARLNQLKQRKIAVVARMKGRAPLFKAKYRGAGNHLDFFLTLAERIAEFRPQIIHANDLLTLPAAIRYKSRVDPNVVVIYDSHELEMHRNKHYGFLRNVSDQLIEWHCIRKADHVITVSEGISDVLRQSYGIERPSVVLNTPSLQVPTGDVDGLKASLGLDETHSLIVYTGNVTFGRGLENLAASLAHLPDNFHVAVVGPRATEKDEALLNSAPEMAASGRFHLVHPVAPHEVTSLIRDADLFINPALNVSLSYDLALPNKLFDAVFSGLPVVVGDLHEMREFVGKNRCGISRKMTNPKEVGDAIKEAMTMKQNGYFAGVNWADLARQYCWESQMENLLHIYARENRVAA